ncbi:MAG: DinB family protein [Chloroflexi bacterium]|nr:DinB family protein [Chloroflexota bacterium]MCY4246355.1 DinB family protein [Chloroflexota bacterium]
MSEMAMYRRWQLHSIDKNVRTLPRLITTIADPAAFQKRDPSDDGDGWTISEVLGHLGDFELYFGARARHIGAGAEEPPQPSMRPAEAVVAQGYAQQDAADLLERWRGLRADSLAFFLSLNVEDDELWQGSAPFGGGPFSLNNQLILTAMHDCDHMNQIVKIIES